MSAATASRVTILQAIAAAADAVAPSHPVAIFDIERVARLLEDAGDIATDLRCNDSEDLDACLLRLAGEALLWLERREADRRAA